MSVFLTSISKATKKRWKKYSKENNVKTGILINQFLEYCMSPLGSHLHKITDDKELCNNCGKKCEHIYTIQNGVVTDISSCCNFPFNYSIDL